MLNLRGRSPLTKEKFQKINYEYSLYKYDNSLSFGFDAANTVIGKSAGFVGKPDRFASGLMICLPFLLSVILGWHLVLKAHLSFVNSLLLVSQSCLPN